MRLYAMPHDTYSSRRRFNAITFDTSSSRDDYRARIGVMTKDLKVLAPDILLLQNVFATADNRYNTAAHLARALHMQCAFLPMRPKLRYLDGRQTRSHSGLAVLSRHPILDKGRIELPSDPRDGQRIAQLCDLDVDGTRLLVANIQASHLAGTEAVRRHQIEKLAERLADAHDFDRILVGGDFNASRIEPALDPIRNLRGFHVVEAAAERGVDRFFALTRTASFLPIPPMTLSDARLEMDRADPETNLFAGERAGLACDITVEMVRAADVIAVSEAKFSSNCPQSRTSALQTAAE
jgi:endonuclease/exonuclease/phosphatase family metal-dependent hydrolase